MSGKIEVRTARKEDYASAAALYVQFHSTAVLGEKAGGPEQWQTLLDHPGSTVFVADLDGEIVGSVTLHILPNMTRNGRSYDLIENVITDKDHRGLGIGRQVMSMAIEAAWAKDYYKIMLLTGKHRTDGGATGFYEKLGFSSDKKYGMQLTLESKNVVPTRLVTDK